MVLLFSKIIFMSCTLIMKYNCWTSGYWEYITFKSNKVIYMKAMAPYGSGEIGDLCKAVTISAQTQEK